MQAYDRVLKVLLTSPAKRLLKQVTNTSIDRWLNVELPQVQQLDVDLLGQTETGGLEHIELQSRNDPQMPIRMLEYRVAIYRRFKVFPRQTVLYVGKKKLNMRSGLDAEDLIARYRLVDASELDGELLLASEDISDNVLAILARLPNLEDAIRSLLTRAGRMDPQNGGAIVNQIAILCGLRESARKIWEELKKMPVTENILDHEMLRPVYQQGLAEGSRELLKKLLEGRFGPLPAAVVAQLDQTEPKDVEKLGLRLLNVSSLDDLFA